MCFRSFNQKQGYFVEAKPLQVLIFKLLVSLLFAVDLRGFSTGLLGQSVRL